MAISGQRADDREQLRNLGAAEAGEWLIQQQQSRPARERPRQLHQAQLLAREAARERLRSSSEADSLESFTGCRERRGAGRLRNVGSDHRILQHGHASKGTHGLERAAHAQAADPVRLKTDQVGSGEHDLPPVWKQETVQEIEQRGLACAIRADDAQQCSLLDFE
jgi:hypothetical protein